MEIAAGVGRAAGTAKTLARAAAGPVACSVLVYATWRGASTAWNQYIDGQFDPLTKQDEQIGKQADLPRQRTAHGEAGSMALRVGQLHFVNSDGKRGKDALTADPWSEHPSKRYTRTRALDELREQGGVAIHDAQTGKYLVRDIEVVAGGGVGRDYETRPLSEYFDPQARITFENNNVLAVGVDGTVIVNSRAR